MKRFAHLAPETSQNQAELAVAHSLRSDFLKSYQFSQGHTGFQKGLWCRIRDYYAQQAGGILAVDMNLFDEVMTNFHYPGAHVKKLVQTGPEDSDVALVTYADGAENQFRFDLADYRNIIAGAPTVRDLSLSLEQICEQTIRRDIYFQTEERGYRAQSDKHASYYREYFIRGRATGSDAFDTLFGSIAGYLQETSHSDLPFAFTLGSLVRAWQPNHPGQSFYPEIPRMPLEGLVTV